MKIIVFGVGNFYQKQKNKLKNFKDVDIVAYADNNQALWNTRVENIPVIAPDTIGIQVYDKILIMSIYVSEIHGQLLSLGIAKDRILTWEYFMAQAVQGKGEVFGSRAGIEEIRGEVLIISTYLNYNGGTLAAVYATQALRQKGISVIMAAPDGSKKFIKEMAGNGLIIVLLPSLPYVFENEKKWIQQFQAVMINTYQMIECAYQVSKFCPTIWWLHEYKKMYSWIAMKNPDCLDRARLKDIGIYAVSERARDNFDCIYLNRINGILSYGIPDMGNRKTEDTNQNKKNVFAVIGEICSLKSQDIFLEAASRIKNCDNVEFWIIGKSREEDYCKKIKKMASEISSVKIWGELTRCEIYKVFPKIDVVVCSSKEDMLPIVITESMMVGKACIVTDVTGSAKYIQNGENGFVVPVNDVQALAERMQWIITNKEEIDKIGLAARKTYEKYFTLDILGQNLKQVLNETMAEWRRTNRET